MRDKADRDDARLVEQRIEAEKRLVETVNKRHQTESAALLSATAHAKQAEVAARIAAERTSAENALTETARAREKAESMAKQAAIQLVEQEREAKAAENVHASSEAAANDAAHARAEAENLLERVAGDREVFTANKHSETTKPLLSSRHETANKSSRVGLVAVLALMVGAGAGYWVKTQTATIDAPVVTRVTASRAPINAGVAPIPAPAVDEPVIELRLDRGLESLTRLDVQPGAAGK